MKRSFSTFPISGGFFPLHFMVVKSIYLSLHVGVNSDPLKSSTKRLRSSKTINILLVIIVNTKICTYFEYFSISYKIIVQIRMHDLF